MPHHPSYDPERAADIVARKLAGQTYSEIAEVYEIDTKRVFQIVHAEVVGGEEWWHPYIPTPPKPEPRLDKLPPFENPYKKAKASQ